VLYDDEATAKSIVDEYTDDPPMYYDKVLDVKFYRQPISYIPKGSSAGLGLLCVASSSNTVIICTGVCMHRPGRLGGVTVRTLDLRSRGRGFVSRSAGRYQVPGWVTVCGQVNHLGI